MLTRLYIDNIRSFSNFTMEPGRIAVLVGPNGGGKSSVLRVLGALQEFLVGGQAASVVFGGSRTHWSSLLEQKIELDAVSDDGTEFAYSLGIMHSADGRNVVIGDERLSANGKLVYRLADGEVALFGDKPSAKPRTTFPFASTRSFIPLLEERPDNQLIMSFRRWLSGVWLFAIRPQDLSISSEGEDPDLSRDGANFVSWYRLLAQEQPQIREALLTDLRTVIPGLSEIRLVGGPSAARVMVLECKASETTTPYRLNLRELSDGQRALLVLYTIKHMVASRAALLMFDEPDNYVAFEEIQPWLAGLRETMASASATLLIISHHPEVIDYLAPDQVLRLWREDGPTRLEQPSVDRSNGLSASELLRLGSA